MVAIIRDYKDGLMLFINRYVQNIWVAEELTEDTFFLLVTKKPRFRADYSFRTWLYTIGRNKAVSYLRRHRSMHPTPIEEMEKLAAETENIERSYLVKEQSLILSRALSQIPEAYARVLHLKYFEEMQNEQIAHVLHKNKRQIENMLYQAKKALKTQLERKGYTHEEL